MSHNKSIFIIAGESSGDQLGADLISHIKSKIQDLNFIGVGGPKMQAEGLRSFFSSSEIALMGPTAILKNYFHLRQRLKQTIQSILAINPKVLVVIDSPEFTQRVAKQVRKRAPWIKIIKYVAPQVWAWRSKRAKKMKAYIDEILALLPFEPDIYHKLDGPKTTYVGHPLISKPDLWTLTEDDKIARRKKPIPVVVLFGSRINEISKLMSPFKEALERLNKSHNLHISIPVVTHLKHIVETETKSWNLPVQLITNETDKWKVFRQSRLALAASGTVTLELALAETPMVVAYKVEKWLAFILRRMIKVNTVVLPNLIVGEKIIPELLQDDANVENLYDALENIINCDAVQKNGFVKLKSIIQAQYIKAPGELAAERVLSYLN